MSEERGFLAQILREPTTPKVQLARTPTSALCLTGSPPGSGAP